MSMNSPDDNDNGKAKPFDMVAGAAINVATMNNKIVEQPPAAVQVYLRIRPLIPEEDGHDSITFKVDNDTTTQHATFHLKLPDRGSRPTPNGAFAGAPPFRHRRERFVAHAGFAGVLREDCSNEMAYRTTVRPLVEPIASLNESACVFTYGHTGSGKSHTLLGYGDEMGMYKLAAVDLLEKIRERDPTRCLLVTVVELYKGDRVVDLLTQRACTVRQDAKGRVRIRGPMVQDDEGRIEQQPLGKICLTSQQVVECVETACESRRVGTSTHHDQSSRSHLVMELEIVTPGLIEQRNLLLKRDAHLTRLKWLQTERTFNKHGEKLMPEWTKEHTSTTVRRQIQQYEKLVKSSRREVSQLSKALGGTLVFCDLAGNEYARDSASSTDEEREEAAEINKSLLTVKEMIRSLGQRQRGRENGTAKKMYHHVPYRDSKLTMCLKRHLETRAVMLAHISPSAESLKKTMNTLNYSSMVSVGSNATASKRGKENNKW
mmetsp:Transcript_21621/g.52223  ORF Transcript_21621/g.52223 Transcript_21621/m.52223 type:complete len:489 (-) Transcript_21621:175-1641(-)